MSCELHELVLLSQSGSDSSTLAVLARFEPLIKKYARKLGYEDAVQEMILAFLDVLKCFPKNADIVSDGQVVNYIARSLYHEYIKLSQKNYTYKVTEVYFEDEIEVTGCLEISEVKSGILKECKDLLTPYQKTIIYLHYFGGYSITEIANMYGVTRQAINKVKNIALKILKNNS